MLNRIVFILFCAALSTPCFAQRIEGESRPYQFDIDRIIEFESKSAAQGFTILPFKQRIAERIEFEMKSWFNEVGHQFEDDPEFEEKVRKEIEILKPLIFNAVGKEMLATTKPDLFFIPEELKFEILFQGFEPFEVEVPVEHIEAFKENFQRIKYANEDITFSEFEKFVIKGIDIYDPVSDAVYAYQRKNPDPVKSPEFSVTLKE